MPSTEYTGRHRRAEAGVTVDSVLRALYDSRSMRRHPLTDEEWEAVKKNPLHRSSLRVMRDDAIEMIENGEFE